MCGQWFQLGWSSCNMYRQDCKSLWHYQRKIKCVLTSGSLQSSCMQIVYKKMKSQWEHVLEIPFLVCDVIFINCSMRQMLFFNSQQASLSANLFCLVSKLFLDFLENFVLHQMNLPWIYYNKGTRYYKWGAHCFSILWRCLEWNCNTLIFKAMFTVFLKKIACVATFSIRWRIWKKENH